MAPTDADKIGLLVTALDRLILTMQYGKYDDKMEALLAAAEAKRVAQVAVGTLPEAEIEELRRASAANEQAMAKLVPTLAPLADELLQLRRQTAEHVFREKVLRDRIRELERQIELASAT
jgi:septal ring factor EnvC (AmiA/AmiB activator)